jgi:hypothetical protein
MLPFLTAPKGRGFFVYECCPKRAKRKAPSSGSEKRIRKIANLSGNSALDLPLLEHRPIRDITKEKDTMKRLLLTTALVAFTSAPVFAQTSTDATDAGVESREMSAHAEAGLYLEVSGETTIYGSEFLGKNVYVTADESHPRTTDGVPDGWENVATVDDVLMTRDGEIRGILVDVGGFLGIGARPVALDMDALDIVYDSEGEDFYVVFTSTREELEAAPEYDRAADLEARPGTWDMTSDTGAQPQADATGSVASDAGADPQPETMAQDQEPTAAPVAGDTQTTQADQGLAAPTDGYTAAARGELSVDDLKAAEVFDATDERIAGVSDVLVTEDGEVTNIIVDVGGFLGIGAKSVAIAYADVEVFHGDDRSDLRIHLPMSREQLEEMPEYEG